MMIGAAKRFSVSYSVNQNYFDIFTRKYMHNFRICIDDSNFEGQKALEIASSNMVLVSLKNRIILFNLISHSRCGEIPIPLLDSTSREPN